VVLLIINQFSKFYINLNDLNDSIVKLNEAVSNDVNNRDLMIEKLIINDRVAEVWDKSQGYFRNSNKLLFTYSIIEF